MAAPLPLTILLTLLLSSLSLQVFARFEPQPSNLNTIYYQEVKSTLANPYQVFTSPEKLLMTSRADDADRQREMSSEQRKRLKERRKRFEALSPEEKQRLRAARNKFKQLPPEERERLKQKWRALPPEERNKAIRRNDSKKPGL
jgi:septal ring factor EnvC (AmiA/AmiB activator)